TQSCLSATVQTPQHPFPGRSARGFGTLSAGPPAGDRGASGRRPDAPADDRTPLPPAPDSPVGDQAAPPGDQAAPPGRSDSTAGCGGPSGRRCRLSVAVCDLIRGLGLAQLLQDGDG